MKISVVIPTKDEAELLPKLLESIKTQDFDDYEVIVADAFSSDRTREIAVEYGAMVVDGGMPGAGRNAGARAATGEFLVFLDADVILPDHFLKNLYTEMQERYIDVATCPIRPISDIQLDRVIHKLINMTILANLRVDPKAFGFCIFITKRLFNRIGGFDETIKVAEDNDLVKRASEYRPLRYLNSTHVHVSVRRFEKEGRLAYMAKGIGLNVYRTFKGEIRFDNDVVTYNFGGYDKGKENLKTLDKIEQRLIKAEKNYKKHIENIKAWGTLKPEEVDEDQRNFRKKLKSSVNDLAKLLSISKKNEKS
ncbi:MAG: glycosyltransferase [Spirochaetales bacterium]|uniref:Glycosyltransferase n=1 Tax=Candidatus Thalassospirochaeta sargassi TaxID=3119039 RepID=A0AAJ1IAL2_9SPIO|nr:glycosyltransferase [Spirochaetales bacterium]